MTTSHDPPTYTEGWPGPASCSPWPRVACRIRRQLRGPGRRGPGRGHTVQPEDDGRASVGSDWARGPGDQSSGPCQWPAKSPRWWTRATATSRWPCRSLKRSARSEHMSAIALDP